MKKYLCRSPGCQELLDTPGYCSNHIKKDYVKPFENAVRSNEGLYNTTRWRKLRKETISKNPFCSICGISEKEVKLNGESLEVHHLERPKGNLELFFNEENCIPVCLSCHRRLTQEETIKSRKKC
ncbi:MAG: HNH endonuclease [Mycoplasmataceae bacterium]|jgi:5-methylcytosine-specific restriction protein A|nr:HNH endonuclease [Mycoplasmataceae bacterium]